MIRKCKNPDCGRYYHCDSGDVSFSPLFCCRLCRIKCDPEFKAQDDLSQESMRVEYEKQEVKKD